jgi:hypothetical protein
MCRSVHLIESKTDVWKRGVMDPETFCSQMCQRYISDGYVWVVRCHYKQIPEELQSVDLAALDVPGAAIWLCPNETSYSGDAAIAEGDGYVCGKWLLDHTFQGTSQTVQVCVCPTQ